jgi:hypothetical protein
MATPSVLTVPSMYGDGILYSGPSAYGPELASQPVDLQTDFANNSGGTITSANTFDTVGGSFDGIASQLSAFSLTVGNTYEIEIRGITTSNGFTLGDLATTGNQYGSGFGVHRFVSLNTRLWIRQNNTTGTTTITHLSIRQVTQGSDFDFTRGTTGTRINEEGYIEDVPYNLITYSEDFSVWSKEATVTLTANYGLAPNGPQTSTRMQMDANDSIFRSVSSGNTFSVHIKGAAGETIRLANGGSLTHTLTGRWDRISLYDTGNISSLITINTYSSATARDIQIWGAQVVKGDQPKNYLPTTDRLNLPRLNYPVYGGCPSLLLEPQRTNRNSESEDLSQWDPVHGSVSTDLITNPTGNTNKSYWIPDTTNNFHHIDRSSSVTSGLQYTISIFLKSDGSDFTNFVLLNTPQGNADGNAGPIVDIKNGTKVGFNNADYDVNIVDYVNGWRRYAWTVTTNTTTLELNVNPLPTSAISSYNGNGNNGIYVYGLPFGS